MTGAPKPVIEGKEGEFTVEDLGQDWALDPNDIELALSARGELNRLRLAIEICSLRTSGGFIVDWSHVPMLVVNHIARQLSLPPQEVPPHSRRQTTAAYRSRIREHLGYGPFLKSDASALGDELLRLAHDGSSREAMHVCARAWLRRRKLVRPGQSVIDRLVASAHAHAESSLLEAIADALPERVREAIDQRVLDVTEGTSVLSALHRSAKSAKAVNILEQLDRLEQVELLDLSSVVLPVQATPARLAELAEQTKRYNAWELRRLRPSRRYALVVSYMLTARSRLLDESVVMTDHYITLMWQRAKRRHHDSKMLRWQQSNDATSKVLQRVRAAIERGLDPDANETLGAAWETALGGDAGAREFLGVVEDAERGQKTARHGLRDELCAAYGPLRRFLPRVMGLPLRAEPGSESIIKAIELVRALDSGSISKLPRNAPFDFVPKKWRAGLVVKGRIVNRSLWETSLAVAIRDGLRSGDLYLDGSKQHASFTELIYSAEQWEHRRDEAYEELGVPRDPEVVLDSLCKRFEAAARGLSRGLENNTFTSIKARRLHLRAEKKLEEPPGTDRLRAILHGGLPRTVRLERVLIDVDNWCRFSDAFKGAQAPRQKPSRRAALLAALVGHGTNLGVDGIRDSTEEFQAGEIERASRQCVRPETLRAANRAIVNFHAALPISQAWGDGTRSSSDGQRFAISADSILSSYYPRYFGYYEQAVNVYTHTSDLHSVYATRVISCGPREALFVLDGILENDTILEPTEHATDSHGATLALFGMCHLLGLRLHPRIARLKHVTLFRPDRSTSLGKLSPLFGKSPAIKLDLIRSQWDSLVRVAASLRHRTAPAHVVLQRMTTNTNSQLSLALAELGKLERTIFILRYLQDDQMRAAIRRQLNRTEGRHALAKYLFRGKQGTFTTADTEQLTSKATALSVLSNAIVCWNTVRFQHTLATSKPGESLPLELLGHISPMRFGHVNAQGMYRFEL